ncbi:DUF1178 family protein [Variovorax sp. KK3]|uniref:DUF1178 family protein n=1 Tax=Variovorax sp. KK3 TaxID=1855728 RepID=UPI00097C7F9D|nr:DUF1178 family protein [Variovorax sp. KK3]
MKVLDLQCAHGHGFEGWFGSHQDFDTQMAGGLVACPLCGDTVITKLLSAPRLNFGAAKPPDEAASSASRAPSTPAPPTTPASPASPSGPAADAAVDSAVGHWLRAVREVMSMTEDVGPRFADEVRKMHYGDAEQRGIRGQATPEEARELEDEGISVYPLPVPPALKETLQ